jgi:hypothetical protein
LDVGGVVEGVWVVGGDVHVAEVVDEEEDDVERLADEGKSEGKSEEKEGGEGLHE